MQIIKCGRFFNFGHNAGLFANDCTCGNNVSDPLDKRQGHPINTFFQRKLQIFEVFFSQRVGVQNNIWQIYPLIAFQRATNNNLGGEAGVINCHHLKYQFAIIHQQPRPGIHGFEYFWMRQTNTRRIAGVGFHIKNNLATCFDNDAVFDQPNTKFWPLQIYQNTCGHAGIRFHGAYGINPRPLVGLCAMRKIQPKNVDTSIV